MIQNGQSIQSPVEAALANEGWKPRVYKDLIVDRTGQGDVVLLHPTEARWALCNEAALEFAALLDGSHTVQQIASFLAQEYGVEVSRINADLRLFLQQLYSANLIENLPIPIPSSPAAQPKPPSLTIYITEECNLRCRHCAIVEGKMPEPLLKTEEIRDLIDKHCERYNNPTVTFLGGEPLLRPDCLELLEYAHTRTTEVKISTNGLLVDGKTAGRLVACGAEIQVSLDGADSEVHDYIRGKGTFDKTWSAIERIIAAGGASQLVVATVLTRASIRQIQAMIDRIDAIGPIRLLRFLNLNKQRAADTHWDRIAPEIDEMHRVYRWLLFDVTQQDRAGKTPLRAGFPGYVPDAAPRGDPWCPLGQTLVVDSQGETYNCPILNTKDYQIGNARETAPADQLGEERNQSLRRQILNRRYTIEECRTCAWRNFCQGGCAAYSSLQSGSLYVNDQHCEFRRNLYREMVSRSADH